LRKNLNDAQILGSRDFRKRRTNRTRIGQKQRRRKQEHHLKKEKQGRSMFLQIVPYHKSTTNSKNQSIIPVESNRNKVLWILHYGKH
jgi:hypothetical protein